VPHVSIPQLWSCPDRSNANRSALHKDVEQSAKRPYRDDAAWVGDLRRRQFRTGENP